ncbi:MAG: DUF5060 domain-containing protein [Planctomycetales bacterium]|nr:DUF5060 domain-containing protein [Planctomycetales bacterium]
MKQMNRPTIALEILENRELLTANETCQVIPDSDLNGTIDNIDLAHVADFRLYESGRLATTEHGDWNGDSRFDSSDLVYAFSKIKQADGAVKARFCGIERSDESDSRQLAKMANEQLAVGDVYSLIELAFDGPEQTPTDTPARDIRLSVTFRHETSGAEHTVSGFWDGDGQGGTVGNQFMVRFTPTEPGQWNLADVSSNNELLDNQHEGSFVVANESDYQGFWVPTTNDRGHSWFQRSDGSYEYITGNTHYTFLTERDKYGNPSGGNIEDDVRKNAEYFNKIRFSILGDLAPHPTDKPFFDDNGVPTDDGAFAHRPNPAWFHDRTDLAVKTAFEHDVIADLILSGVATLDSRRVLTNCKTDINTCDRPWEPEPIYLQYVAGRYGAFPNVWMTLVNEWDLREPLFTPDEIISYGTELQKHLPYPTPVSVHGKPGPWNADLDGDWNGHIIIQAKRTEWRTAYNSVVDSQQPDPKPLINDEMSYQGAGDGHAREDTVQAFLGTFQGGAYGTTGYKSGLTEGQYVSGNFSVEEHTAAENIKWFREQIDNDIRFWEMASMNIHDSPHQAAPWANIGVLLSDGQLFMTTWGNTGRVRIDMSEGEWSIEQWDINEMTRTVVESEYTGVFEFVRQTGEVTYFMTRTDLQPLPGDSNGDGRFDSTDLVHVFIAAKFETGKPATFEEGDWNGDGVFNSRDFVEAFINGKYQG